jgi:hypothetical protein
MPTAPAPTLDTHLALAVFHRWFEVYETAMTPERLDRQLEILDPEVRIIVTRGEARGHASYLAGVRGLTPTDRHAHHVQSAKVEGLTLTADVLYQRQPAGGPFTSARLAYEVTFKRADDALIIEALKTEPQGLADSAAFKEAYTDNRTGAFVHAWLAAMERLDGDVRRFDALLSERGFELNLSSAPAPVTARAALEQWLKAIPVTLSCHHVEALSVEPTPDGLRAVNALFAWQGVDRGGAVVEAKTRHRWLLEDNGERFCRMVRMQSERA